MRAGIWMTAAVAFGASFAWAAKPAVAAAPPSATELLARYDQIMGPSTFESEVTMRAHRDDGTERRYAMRFLKGGDDKFRIWFKEPSAVKGQEMLRQGDNLWIYLPSMKRATRMASRENFQGGDFNNADVLRVDYTKDYLPTLVESGDPALLAVELKAKNPDTAYDKVKLWVRASDLQPARGQYFGTSGQMIRSAEFSDYREFEKGYLRPAKVLMRNEQVKTRHSVLEVTSMKLGVDAPAQRFVQSDLGK